MFIFVIRVQRFKTLPLGVSGHRFSTDFYFELFNLCQSQTDEHILKVGDLAERDFDFQLILFRIVNLCQSQTDKHILKVRDFAERIFLKYKD